MCLWNQDVNLAKKSDPGKVGQQVVDFIMLRTLFLC